MASFVTDAGASATEVTRKCFFHLESVQNEESSPMTAARWIKVVNCCKSWLTLDGRGQEIAREFEAKAMLDGGKSFRDVFAEHPDFAFHPTCYRRFTDINLISKAEKRVALKRAKGEDTTPPSEPPAKRPHYLRSESTSLVQKSTILPATCIICKKADKWITTSGRRVRDKLMKALTHDGGLLRQAAQAKTDEEVLKHIRDKSCSCLEVRYHRGCYKSYTLGVDPTRRPRHSSGSGGQSLFVTHQKAYEAFCKEVIEKRMKAQEEVLRLTKLQKLFVNAVKDEDDVQLPNLRSDVLKAKLEKDFPELVFHLPTRRNEATLVYYSGLSTGSVVDQYLVTSSSTPSESSEESEDACAQHKDKDLCHTADQSRILYLAGLILRSSISAKKGLDWQWPPTAKDIDSINLTDLIPAELFNMVAMCVGGIQEPFGSEHMMGHEDDSKIWSICQDIVYLASKGRHQTPKSLALGLTVRHMTGSTHLLQLLSMFGHCCSPDTIVAYETSLAMLRRVTAHLIPDGFMPEQLLIMAWDNIDFNEETMSGRGTTHHTNGVMLQSCEVQPSVSIERPAVKKGMKTLQHVPSQLNQYHRVKRVGPACGEMDVQSANWSPLLTPPKLLDFTFVLARMYGGKEVPGWTGYNIAMANYPIQMTSVHYLPVIEATPTDMTTVNTVIQRSLDMADRFQRHQVVLVFDQAIYAKIQEIRWANDILKERLVVRLGEFHTCMSFLSVLGKRFGDAGLKDILIESLVVAEGSIHGVLSGHHYNRAIHSLKVVNEAFEQLRFEAFIDTLPDDQQMDVITKVSELPWQDLKDSEAPGEILQMYAAFIESKRKDDATFDFWSSFLDMMSLLLTFIRATRQSSWDLHVAVIRSMLPWFFAYDRTNYSRYLPAYWAEMVELPKTHPSVYEDIRKQGAWTVQRQDTHPFASIACDQAIEETMNRDCKIQGGIKHFTLNKAAVQRWILAQPERAAVARSCELMCGYAGTCNHHTKPKELSTSRISKVRELVESVKSTTKSMINPFTCTDGQELLNLSSGAVAKEKVKNDLLSAHDVGESALQNFLSERISGEASGSIYAVIKHQRLKTFKDNQSITSKSSDSSMVKSNKSLYSRLLIVGQSREINIKDVMTYCLGEVPFPLANGSNSLVKTDKSSLLKLLEDNGKDRDIHLSEPPCNSALIVDAMALLQSLSSIPDTFGELALQVLGKLESMARLYKCPRVDWVCDTYPAISIKGLERSKRAGTGSESIKIYGRDQKTPRQYKKFLADGTNKEALLEFMFSVWQCTTGINIGKFVVSHGKTCHELTWPNGGCEVAEVPSLRCDHEEADTRLILHAQHASREQPSVVIKSPDTDVAILALGHVEHINAQVLFMTGRGNSQRIINITTLADHLGMNVCRALIGLHVFSGCDSTSAFYGKGKKKPLDLALQNVNYLAAFEELGAAYIANSELINILEEFVCNLYGHKCKDVNEARYLSFCATSSEKCLPPCKDALIQHIRRCAYQAAIGRRATVAIAETPSPHNYGWTVKDGNIKVKWMTQPPAPKSLMEVVACGCKTSTCAQGRCLCRRGNLKCTDLCKCTNCSNKEADDDDDGNTNDDVDIGFDFDAEFPA